MEKNINSYIDYAKDIHLKYALSDRMFDLVWQHCQIVKDICLDIMEINHLDVDKDTVILGALLHDIGTYKEFNVLHGFEGEKILRSEGLPEAVCRIASHHTGVGLNKSDILKQKIELPLKDYLAETEEEEIVMYADKFHSKTTPPISIVLIATGKRYQFLDMKRPSYLTKCVKSSIIQI